MFVSVIIPSYNHAPYLQERIESVLNQSFQDFEVIILDDKSPDESDKILEQYKNHPKVSHCIINEQNSGSTFFQWNKGITLAKGDLIWIAESDDVADQAFLATLVPQFAKNPQLVLAYTQSYRMSATKEITGTWKDQTDPFDSEKFNQDFTQDGLQYIENFLCYKNTIPNASGVVFKKQIYLNVGGANPNLKYIGDWNIWIKIVSQGEIFFCAKPLNYFRYHDSSVIAQSKTEIKNLISMHQQHIDFENDIKKFITQYTTCGISSKKKIYTVLNREENFHYKSILRLYCQQQDSVASKSLLNQAYYNLNFLPFISLLLKYTIYIIRY